MIAKISVEQNEKHVHIGEKNIWLNSVREMHCKTYATMKMTRTFVDKQFRSLVYAYAYDYLTEQ